MQTGALTLLPLWLQSVKPGTKGKQLAGLYGERGSQLASSTLRCQQTRPQLGLHLHRICSTLPLLLCPSLLCVVFKYRIKYACPKVCACCSPQHHLHTASRLQKHPLDMVPPLSPLTRLPPRPPGLLHLLLQTVRNYSILQNIYTRRDGSFWSPTHGFYW